MDKKMGIEDALRLTEEDIGKLLRMVTDLAAGGVLDQRDAVEIYKVCNAAIERRMTTVRQEISQVTQGRGELC